MRLNDEEKRMLNGQEGEAKKLAMEILTQVGDSMDADSFVEIASVQAMAHGLKSWHVWAENAACRPPRTRLPSHSVIGKRWDTTKNMQKISTVWRRP